MADYIVTSGELTTVADAIREKNGTSGSLSWPNGFVEGISFGGGSWETVYDGSVTTEENEFGMIVGLIEDVPELTADELKITFNGVEYICPKNAEFGSYGAPFNEGTFDWSEYPFNINGSNLVTQTAGTYTLKIEEQQSGGGDFSTAEVTLINNYGGVEISLIAPTYVDSEEISTSINYITAQPNETITQNAFLYKNSCFAEIKGFEQLIDPEPLVTVSGNVVYEGDGFFTITGDCTITIEGGLS